MSLVDAAGEAHSLVSRFLSTEVQDAKLFSSTKLRVAETFSILREALVKYNLDELSISYNGGKDCLVMLVIFLAAIYEKFGQDIPVDRLDSVFINTEEYFPEISDFLQLSIEEYKLALVNLQIHDLKQGFTKYLNMKPKVKAIIVGIRKIDPYAKGLQSFQITDNNWPRFIRVNPILNWEYDEIWFFLRKNKIKYCKLYDLGYTSIGGIHNTIKNPLLLKDGTEDEYFPAYCLEDKSKERLSRI